MGNCLRKCFEGFDTRRQYLQTRYSTYESDVASVEFENLMDEGEVQNEMSKLVTEREKQLVSNKRYNTLIEEQHLQDAEIDRKLHDEEERIQREEEAYIAAKREAARIAALQRQLEEAAAISRSKNGPKNWKAGDDGDWEVAGGDDDFEMFLESVRARSLKATAHLRKDSFNQPDSPSSNTPNTPPRERSHTGGSNSIELEWDHNEDLVILPNRKESNLTEDEVIDSAQSDSQNSPTTSQTLSADLDWDTEFTASEDKDTQNLIKAEYKNTPQLT